jgi:rare lipoprotein A
MIRKLRFPLEYLLIIGVLFLLAACSTVQREVRDGPPPFDVDTSKISDATPKNEPLSPYGNKHYRVRGKKYHVLKNSKGYRARGIASWYGTKFHKHRTSSGERYNMFAMTAASRTLPLPTYVEVTNLRNKRKVVVKVNDRGPFEKNRLIDLSYVAAKKLGVTQTGTAYVEVRSINPKTYKKSISPPKEFPFQPVDTDAAYLFAQSPVQKKGSHLFVQVGAFSESNNAYRLRAQLAQLLKEPVYIKKSREKNHSTYRVQIGPLVSRDSSKDLVAKLKAAGINQSISVIE